MGLLDPPALSPTLAASTYADRSRIVRARDGRLDVWGHSYAFGIGASDRARSWAALLAEGLRLRLNSWAISGTAVASDASGASWVSVLQNVTRNGVGAVPGSGVASTARGGFASPGGVAAVMYGINDLNTLGDTVAAIDAVRQALRVIFSRLRAGAIFEQDDPTVTYSSSPAWMTATASTAQNSGAGYRATANNGATFTIALPADFPGGTLCIGLIAFAGVGNGGTVSATIAGQSMSFIATSTRTGSATPFVWRIKNVPSSLAGTSITFTVSAITSSLALDYWQWEPPVADCPLVIALQQPLPVDYSAYGTPPAPGPPTDAGVLALRQVHTEVAAEFDERVMLVDLSSLDRSAGMFSAADNLHPSDKGHGAIAALCLAAVKSAKWTITNGAVSRVPRTEHGTAAPTTNRVYWYAGDRIINTAPTELGTSGSKYVTTGWICTADGRPGTWLPTNALTGN